MLLEARRDVAPHDPDRAREMAMVAAAIAAFGAATPGRHRPEPRSSRSRSDASARAALLRRADGRAGRRSSPADWAARPRRCAARSSTGDELELDDLELLPNLGIAALHLGDTLAPTDYHERLLTEARDSGAAVTVLYALTRLAFSDLPNGRWATRRRASDRGRCASVRATGQPVLAAMPLATLLLLSALRGRGRPTTS